MAKYELEADPTSPDAAARWFINGKLEQDQSTSFQKIWNESPGIKQKVEAERISGSKRDSWDVIVCGYNQKQTAILGIACLAIECVG